MIRKSPSGALSPYYYKGGYFHGIHYGSYFGDETALLAIMGEEEAFILRSPEKRRVLIDLYETTLTKPVLDALVRHVDRLTPRIVKLAVAADRFSLWKLKRALRNRSLNAGQLHFCTDMEEGKTWLVRDSF